MKKTRIQMHEKNRIQKGIEMSEKKQAYKKAQKCMKKTDTKTHTNV